MLTFKYIFNFIGDINIYSMGMTYMKFYIQKKNMRSFKVKIVKKIITTKWYNISIKLLLKNNSLPNEMERPDDLWSVCHLDIACKTLWHLSTNIWTPLRHCHYNTGENLPADSYQIFILPLMLHFSTLHT